jgi:hypothetical protein
MIKRLSKYKYQIILVLVGIAWISFLNELMQIKQQDTICNDCDNYRESASYFYHDFKTHYFRPIGMAIISGLPYLLGGSDTAIYEFSLKMNILTWLGSALMLFCFLRKQVPINIAFLFTLLFYSILSFVFINFQLLTESIFSFLMLAVFYFLDKYYTEKSFPFLTFAISISLFAMLIKPSVKFFTIFICIYFAKTILKNYKNKSNFFIVLSLFLIGFQYAKMKKEYGNYTLSYIDSVTYYNYLGSKAFFYQTNRTLNQNTNERAKFLEKLCYPEQRNVANKDFLNQIKNNRLNLFKAYFSNLLENTKTPNGFITTTKNLNNKKYYDTIRKIFTIISKYQNRFFTLFGFILAFYYILKSNKNQNLYGLMGLYILYTIFISGVSCSQGDRFHVVFFPFVIILFAKFYQEKKFFKFLNKTTLLFHSKNVKNISM